MSYPAPRFLNGKKLLFAEAFCLMYYENEATRKGFVVWNSRDGVTPFTCHEDGQMYTHQHWYMDKFAPNFKMEEGQRYFRDTTPEEAADFARRRIEQFKGTAYEVAEDSERYPELLKNLTKDFTGGPILVTYPA